MFRSCSNFLADAMLCTVRQLSCNGTMFSLLLGFDQTVTLGGGIEESESSDACEPSNCLYTQVCSSLSTFHSLLDQATGTHFVLSTFGETARKSVRMSDSNFHSLSNWKDGSCGYQHHHVPHANVNLLLAAHVASQACISVGCVGSSECCHEACTPSLMSPCTPCPGQPASCILHRRCLQG